MALHFFIELVLNHIMYYMVAQKVPAKFIKETSVWADRLCIGYLGQWEGEYEHARDFFMTLYIAEHNYQKFCID